MENNPALGASDISNRLNIYEQIFTYVMSIYAILCFLMPAQLSFIKLILLLIAIFSSLFLKFKVDKKTLLIFSLLIIYNIYESIVGFARYGAIANNGFKVFVVYMCMYYFVMHFFRKQEMIEIMNKAIHISAFLITLYFFYCLFGIYGYTPYAGDFLQQGFRVPQGNEIIKVYALNLLSYFFLFPYLTIYFINSLGSKKIKIFDLINYFLTVLAVIITLRRGMIMASIIAIVIVLFFVSEKKRGFIKKIFVLSFIFSILMTISLTLFRSKTSEEGFVNQLMSSFNFTPDRKTNYSNYLRVEQFLVLMDGWQKHPVVGNGFGAHFGYYARSTTDIDNFELQYMRLLYFSGIIGLLLAAFFFFRIFYISVKLIKKNDFCRKHIAPSLAGCLTVVIANATNPVLNQMSALIMLFYVLFVVNSFQYEIKKV